MGRRRAGVPADGLARLELDVGSGVSLLPRGRGALGPPGRMEALAGMLAADPRPVVADCGVLDACAPGVPVAAIATQSLLVIRPCYLALRRVAAAPIRPSGVVLVVEPGRALGRQRRRERRRAPRSGPRSRSTRRWPARSTPGCSRRGCRAASTARSVASPLPLAA